MDDVEWDDYDMEENAEDMMDFKLDEDPDFNVDEDPSCEQFQEKITVSNLDSLKSITHIITTLDQVLKLTTAPMICKCPKIISNLDSLK